MLRRPDRPGRRGGEVADDGVDVDLLTQPVREGCRRALGVDACPVEPTIDRAVDARPNGLEEPRDDERRDGDGHRLRPEHRAERTLQDEHDGDVRREQDDRHETVRDAAADQPVDVVQPVAHDRDTNRERDRVQRNDSEVLEEQGDILWRRDERDAERHHGDRRRSHEPADLVARDVIGSSVPQHEGPDRQEEERDADERLDFIDRPEDPLRARDVERVSKPGDSANSAVSNRMRTVATATVSAAAMATQRQRGDRKRPSGNSSGTPTSTNTSDGMNNISTRRPDEDHKRVGRRQLDALSPARSSRRSTSQTRASSRGGSVRSGCRGRGWKETHRCRRRSGGSRCT